MISAIEIYNKPDFAYREETFSVLCVNSWELLPKAYSVKKSGNKSLCMYEFVTNKNGIKSKRKRSKSKAGDAIKVQISNDPTALKVQLTDEQFRDRWPLDYARLTEECRGRYEDFKLSQKYHDIRKSVLDNEKYCKSNLDPGNPKSTTKHFYGMAIFNLLDKKFTRKN